MSSLVHLALFGASILEPDLDLNGAKLLQSREAVRVVHSPAARSTPRSRTALTCVGWRCTWS